MKNLDTVYAEKIAAEYDQKPASKLIALKKLDNKAKLPSIIFDCIWPEQRPLTHAPHSGGYSLKRGVLRTFGW